MKRMEADVQISAGTPQLIALEGAPGHEAIVAVARYISNPNRDGAEFAIVVADAWQGRGLGYALFAGVNVLNAIPLVLKGRPICAHQPLPTAALALIFVGCNWRGDEAVAESNADGRRDSGGRREPRRSSQ